MQTFVVVVLQRAPVHNAYNIVLYYFQGFAVKLKNLLKKPSSPFFEVVWDPPHWANLGIEDVIDGKVGNSKAFMKRLIDRSAAIHKIFQRGKSLAEARSKANQMKTRLQLTSRTCATRFSTSQIHEFKKLISSLHVYIATYIESHQLDSNFELKKWEICGQDFVADLCGVVDVVTPVVTYLIDLQGMQVPIWKAAVWFHKVIADLNALGELSIHSPPESCANLSSKIDEIKQFRLNGQELVDGWLITETNVCNTASQERIETATWEARDLLDVQNDLQRLAKDLAASLNVRHDKCLSTLQTNLMCIDIDNIFSLLVGSRKQNGYPDLTEEDNFVKYGKDDFRLFYAYVCSLKHIKQLAENHFTELKLKEAYSDEILAKLKNTLKIVLWTPKHVHILCKWLKCLTTTTKNQVSRYKLHCSIFLHCIDALFYNFF